MKTPTILEHSSGIVPDDDSAEETVANHEGEAATSCRPTLKQIADQVPLGWECRSCGASVYNHLTRIDRFLRTGEPCCANFRVWVDAAQRGEPTVSQRHSEKLRERDAARAAIVKATGSPISAATDRRLPTPTKPLG